MGPGTRERFRFGNGGGDGGGGVAVATKVAVAAKGADLAMDLNQPPPSWFYVLLFQFQFDFNFNFQLPTASRYAMPHATCDMPHAPRAPSLYIKAVIITVIKAFTVACQTSDLSEVYVLDGLGWSWSWRPPTPTPSSGAPTCREPELADCRLPPWHTAHAEATPHPARGRACHRCRCGEQSGPSKYQVLKCHVRPVGTVGRWARTVAACSVRCQSEPSASLVVRNRNRMAFGQYLRIALQSISHLSSDPRAHRLGSSHPSARAAPATGTATVTPYRTFAVRSPVHIAPLLKCPEDGGRRVDSLADIVVCVEGGLAHSLCAVLSFDGRVRLDGLQHKVPYELPMGSPGSVGWVCLLDAMNGVSPAMQSEFTPRGSSSYSSP
jgi:hypothetical protein